MSQHSSLKQQAQKSFQAPSGKVEEGTQVKSIYIVYIAATVLTWFIAKNIWS